MMKPAAKRWIYHMICQAFYWHQVHIESLNLWSGIFPAKKTMAICLRSSGCFFGPMAAGFRWTKLLISPAGFSYVLLASLGPQKRGREPWVRLLQHGPVGPLLMIWTAAIHFMVKGRSYFPIVLTGKLKPLSVFQPLPEKRTQHALPPNWLSQPYGRSR